MRTVFDNEHLVFAEIENRERGTDGGRRKPTPIDR
jgi:hypothetical protein